MDSIGRLVGRITVDDVMDEVREQAERDYQLASGLSQDVETDDNVFRQTTARLPWLLIGMIGGIGNSMILGNFDSTLPHIPKWPSTSPLSAEQGECGNTVLGTYRTRTGKQLAGCPKHLETNSKGICSGRNQCYYYFYAGIYL